MCPYPWNRNSVLASQLANFRDQYVEVMYANNRPTALRARRRRRLRPPSDARDLPSRLASLVAFVRLSQGSLEKRLLGWKTSRLETSTHWLAGGMTRRGGCESFCSAPQYGIPGLCRRRASTDRRSSS